MKTLYRCRGLFDGEQVIDSPALLVEDGVVLRCCVSDEIDDTGLDETIDFDGYITPGFIDAHVHLYSNPADIDYPMSFDTPVDIAFETARALSNGLKMLRNGITTCRCVGSPLALDIPLRDAIAEGSVQGPTIVASGRALCVTGGHGFSVGVECDGADGFRAGVRRVVKDGVDYVKIMVTGGVNSPGPEPGPIELTELEIQTAIETAHAFGRRVAVHTHGNTGIRHCVRHGVDSIEHGVFLSKDIIEMMVEKQTFLVPTLSAPYFAVKEGIEREPENPDHRKSGEIIEQHRAITRAAFLKGVPVAMGSDVGTPYNLYENTPYELILLSEAGFEPQEILTISTRNGGILLGLEGRKGMLRQGYDADFLVFPEAPWKDISVVTNGRRVFQSGTEIL